MKKLFLLTAFTGICFVPVTAQKKPFEFMLYPGERHGIGANNRAKGEHNRAEAYTFYYQHLLQKPVPEVFWKPSVQQARPF